jgi:putative transposase
MSNRPRVIQLFQPHHICQRANARKTIFHTPEDYRTYLNLWTHALEQHRLQLWGFCLMPNHVHFLIAPIVDNSIPVTMNVVQSTFSKILNGIHGTPGHRWVQRYFSSTCAPVYDWVALAYIENNPVRAGLVHSPEDYLYSSAAHHLLGSPSPLPLHTDPWTDLFCHDSWRTTLSRCANKHLWNERLRVATRTGLPFSELLPDQLRDYYRRQIPEDTGEPISLADLLPDHANAAG